MELGKETNTQQAQSTPWGQQFKSESVGKDPQSKWGKAISANHQGHWLNDGLPNRPAKTNYQAETCYDALWCLEQGNDQRTTEAGPRNHDTVRTTCVFYSEYNDYIISLFWFGAECIYIRYFYARTSTHYWTGSMIHFSYWIGEIPNIPQYLEADEKSTPLVMWVLGLVKYKNM